MSWLDGIRLYLAGVDKSDVFALLAFVAMIISFVIVVFAMRYRSKHFDLPVLKDFSISAFRISVFSFCVGTFVLTLLFMQMLSPVNIAAYRNSDAFLTTKRTTYTAAKASVHDGHLDSWNEITLANAKGPSVRYKTVHRHLTSNYGRGKYVNFSFKNSKYKTKHKAYVVVTEVVAKKHLHLNKLQKAVLKARQEQERKLVVYRAHK